MTRLTPMMIDEVAFSLDRRDMLLRSELGIDLQMFAFEAAGLTPQNESELPLVAVVPMSCGKGIINGFTDTVSAIADHIGFKSFVTRGANASGLAEAYQSGAEIIMMADDDEFIAINVKSNQLTNNTVCTALGYVEALRMAEGSLWGKDVAVIGVGRVGCESISLLNSYGVRVHIFDKDVRRCEEISSLYTDVVMHDSISSALGSCRLVINSSPAAIREEWLQSGSTVSWPGMPFNFLASEDYCSHTIIHDPLELGVAVMVATAYSFSVSISEPIPAQPDPMLVIH